MVSEAIEILTIFVGWGIVIMFIMMSFKMVIENQSLKEVIVG